MRYYTAKTTNIYVSVSPSLPTQQKMSQGFFLEKGEDAGRWVKGENRARKRHIWGKNKNCSFQCL